MAGGLEIGKGFFTLALQATEFTKGMASVGSSVASGASKINTNFSGIATSTKKLDDSLGMTVRGVERFTRGFRQVTPVVGHAQEQVYRYQDSLKGLQQHIEITKLRIQQRAAAEQNNLQIIEATRQKIIQQRSAIEALNQTLQKEQQILIDMQTSGKHSAGEIEKQRQAVQNLDKAMMDMERDEARLNRTLVIAEGRQQGLTNSRKISEHFLIRQQQAENRYGSLLQMSRDRVDALKEKIKAKNEARQRSISVTDQASQAEHRQGGILSLILSLFGRGTTTINQFGQSQRHLSTITAIVNERLFKMGSIVRDVLVGAVGGFIGTSLSNLLTGTRGLITTSLESYKNYELLGLSLKALSSRELVNASKGIKTMADVQGDASKQAESLIHWMQDLAIQSPFSVEDISGAFRLGQALGFTSSQTQRLIQDTVNWASATGASGQQIESVVRALGQMHNTGHVTLEDVNQLTDAGLSARDVLRNEFAPEIRRSKKSLEELISDGAIPADRAIKAMAESLEHDFPTGAKDAAGSMTGLINSIGDLKNTALREFFTKTFQTVQPMIASFVDTLTNPTTIAMIRQFGETLGNTVGGALNFLGGTVVPIAIRAFQTFGPAVINAFAFIAALASQAYAWGYNIGVQLRNGLADTIDGIIEIISWIGEQIAYWMEPGSPPRFLPHVDTWGKKTAETYLKGWTDADFGMLDDLKGKINDVLNDLVSDRALKEESVAGILLGSDAAIKAAINEFRRSGAVSEQMFKRIRDAAGPAGQHVDAYVRAMFKSAQATKKAEDAQKRLNDVTDAYDAKLNPLQAKLDAMRRKKDEAERNARIQELQSLVNNSNPAGLGADKEKAQAELEELLLQQQIDSIEAEKNAAVKAEEEKLKAAQKAAEQAQQELAFREELIRQQREQTEIMRRQQELQEGKKKTAEEQAKDDANAKEQYEFNRASTADQIELLKQKQATVRAGSAEYYHLQEQIEQKEESLAEKRTDNTKQQVDESKQAQQAQEKYEDSLGSTEEKLERVRQKLEEAKPGTKEYYNLKMQENKLEEELNKEREKAAKETDKLSDAEFDAAMATKDRAGKIAMLQEKLGGLKEGTSEYYDTLEKLNRLQFQEDAAAEKKAKGGGGAGHKKGKGGPLGGSIFEGLKTQIDETVKPATTAIDKLGASVTNAKESFTRFKERLEPVFAFLRDHSGVIVFILQKLAMSFLVALAIEKILKPLGLLILGLRSFITWGNILFATLTFLGYAWKTNLGGLRDIVADVWSKIQGPLENIGNIFLHIKQGFEANGIEGALEELQLALPGLLGSIGAIGTAIFGGIAQWTAPLIAALGRVFQAVVAWAQSGGLSSAIEQLFATIGDLFSKGSADTSIIAGILGLLGGVSTLILAIVGELGKGLLSGLPILIGSVGELIHRLGDWLDSNGGVISIGIGLAITGIIAAAFEFLVPALKQIAFRIIDLATWLIPQIPNLLSGLITVVTMIGAWFIGRGIPLLISYVVDTNTYFIRKFGEMFPKLGFNLGRLIGSTISKLLIMLVTGISALVVQLWQSIQDGSFKTKFMGLLDAINGWIVGFFKGLIGIVAGLVLGLFEPFADIGKSVLAGIGSSLDQTTAAIIAFFVGLFDQAVQAVKKFLGIASPSSVFIQIGNDIIQGLINGANQLIGAAITLVTNFLNDVLKLFGINRDDVKKTVEDMKDGVVGFFTNIYDDAVEITTNLKTKANELFTTAKNEVTQISNDLWTNLAGAAGWFTKTKNDSIQLFTETQKKISGAGGIVQVMKDATLVLANTLWDGLVGTSGWISKIKNDAISLFTGLYDGVVGTDGLFARTTSTLLGLAASIWGGFVGGEGWITKLVEDIPNKFDEAIGRARAVLEEFVNWISDAIDGFGSDVYSAAISAGEQILEGIRSAIERGIGDLKRYVYDKIRSWLDNIISSAMGNAESGGGEGEGGGGGGSTAQSMGIRSPGLAGARMRQKLATAGKVGNRAANTGQVGTNTVTTNNERHDHYNLTVNTKATTPTVVRDFGMMKSLARAGL